MLAITKLKLKILLRMAEFLYVGKKLEEIGIVAMPRDFGWALKVMDGFPSQITNPKVHKGGHLVVLKDVDSCGKGVGVAR